MMTIAMPTVRVREKSQITIPFEIGKKAGIRPNDILEVELTTNGFVVLKPVHAKTEDRLSAIMKYKGAGAEIADKNNPNATIEAVRNDRDTWTR